MSDYIEATRDRIIRLACDGASIPREDVAAALNMSVAEVDRARERAGRAGHTWGPRVARVA